MFNHLQYDASLPVAYPLNAVQSLMGDIPVRVRAEGECLVAYGFGRQQVAIPRVMIGQVMVHWVRGSKGERTSPSLLVRDRDRGLVLLRVPGQWGPGLDEVCSALQLGMPCFEGTRSGLQTRAALATAPGFRKIRVRPRLLWLAQLAGVLLGLALTGLGATAGVLLALLLPGAIGGARDLIAVAFAVAGISLVLTVITYAKRLFTGILRWAVASARAGAPAPPERFVHVSGENVLAKWLVTVGAFLAIPTLLIWGIAIEAVTVSHGFRDQALVADLRSHGVSVTGQVIDVPYTTTDDHGNVTWHDQANLDFTPPGSDNVTEPDPGIAGMTWPMNPGIPVRVVYDPSDPGKAAVAGQIAGSPWHGAPTGNIVGGIVAFVLLPPAVWLAYRRSTAGRRKATEDAIAGLA